MEPKRKGGTSMTPEELMKPRWKVIGDFPGSPFVMGQVFTIPSFDKEFTRKYWAEEKDKYPHLFRRLEWFEERKEEELSKFVKTPGDDILELIVAGEWHLLNGRTISHKGLSQCVPATETEYNEYLKLKECKSE